MSNINILVADDHSLFRTGFIRMLTTIPNLKVIGEAADGDATLELVKNNEADLITLDLSMPGLSDMALIKEIRRIRPNMKVLIVSMHDESFLVKQTLKSGANGYITKNCTPEDLEGIIKTILKNGRYLAPELATNLAFADEEDSSNSLTSRELQILRMITQSGMSLVDIGKTLKVSPKTVTSHKANIMTKLNATSNLDLIKKAQSILK
jgi:DNA-binding NarL/FixJ family response regulator